MREKIYLYLMTTLLTLGPVVNASAQYCPGGPTSTYDSNVQQVDIIGEAASVISHSGCTGGGGGGITGVENLTAQSVDVTAGSTYSLFVTFDTCGLNYAGAGEVWIDWNQNFTFDPATESIGTSAGTPGTAPWNAPVEFTFTVPASAGNGSTTMRVIQTEGGTNPLDPCASYSWGSVMDFSVVVSGGVDLCSFYPINLSATGITETTADLTWTQYGNASNWNIEFGATGFVPTGTPTYFSVTHPYPLSGLTPSTTYDFYVQADCGGSQSTWSGPYTFTTLDACQAPTALTATNITTVTADLGWTENGTSTTWNIELGPNGFTPTGTPTDTGITENPHTYSGLTAQTSYDYYVQADCGGLTSSWAGPYSFTTSCATVTVFPYIEDFTTWPPLCWDLTGGSQTPVQYGGICAEGSFWGWFSGEGFMTTPLFDISGLTIPVLDFDWSHLYNSSYPGDQLIVQVTDNGGTTWTPVFDLAGAALNSNDGATSTAPGTFVNSGAIELSVFGDTIQIRFIFHSGYGPDCFVDNFRITDNVYPSVTTTPASNVTNTDALSGGNITYEGAAPVTGRGVCWNTSGSPTIADSFTNDGSGTGTFQSQITNLNSATKYYIRAYAENSFGLRYGSQITLTTTGIAMITLGNLDQNFDGTPKAATATTSPTGLIVDFTYDGSSTAPTDVGSYLVGATINDAIYTGTASGTLTINKGMAIVTLGGLDQAYDDTPKTATATTSPTGLDVELTYDGSSTAPTNAGSYTVVATVNDPGYEGTASGTLIISKASATVALGSLGHTYDGTPKAAMAVTYSPSGLNIDITYDGSTTAPTNAGNYGIIATINELNYAGTANGTMVVNKALGSVTLGNLNFVYDNTAKATTATTSPGGMNVDFTYDGAATAPTNAGNYLVVGTINETNYTGSTPGILKISMAGATVTLVNLNQNYDGSPKTATASTSPPVLNVDLTYDGSSTAPTNTGSYAVVGTINDVNYTGTTSGVLTISPVLPTVTTTPASSVITTAALSGGNVTFDGGASVTGRGVCWNTAGSASKADTCTTDGTGTGSFQSMISNLTLGTTYYVRAYAENNVGLIYGNEVSLTTVAVYFLTINKSGRGNGTITSTPAGIDCGADCYEQYDDTTTVTLDATLDAGSKFMGWSGNADCTDGNITMTSDVHCTANFYRFPWLLFRKAITAEPQP